MNFRVEWTTRAPDDLDRLFEFIVERELAREDGDLSVAARAPALCRKAVDDGSIRELIVPFGASGYLVLFDMTREGQVRVIAIRHQREDGYAG